MIVRSPKTAEEFIRYNDLRWRILRAPLNQPRKTIPDELENDSIPIMVCEVDGIPIGVGRANFNSENEAQIRSMAVEQEWQGKGIGSLILKELEKIVASKGAEKIILHARDNAVAFYEKHEYKIIKESYTLFGVIPHFLMEKIV
jgi:ribosomal protein S18 acetylase RimI-like enzyme